MGSKHEETQISQALGLTHISELLKRPPPLRWLLQAYFLPNSLCMMFGASASGKSLIALAVSACIALGRPWNGFNADKGGVVYLAGEGHYGIRRRLLAFAITHNCEEELKNASMMVSDKGASLITEAGLQDVTDAIDVFSEKHGNPVLIVIDTLNRNLGPGDENSAKDMAKLIEAMDTLRIYYKATVLLVHHTGKRNGDSARGSSALRAAMDTELKVEHNSNERRLSVTKMKDARIPEDLAFQLKEVELPWVDEDGNHEISVVLDCIGAPSPRPGKGLSKNSHISKVALISIIESNGSAASWSTPDSAPLKVVTEDQWRKEFTESYSTANPGNSKDSVRKAFSRAKTDLMKLQIVEGRDGFYWLV